MTEIEAEQLLYAEEARKAARATIGQLYVRRDPVTNWPEIIRAMRERFGYSLRRIADALGVAHSTVQRWADGSPPNYEDGAAILKLHQMLAEKIGGIRIL
ncbi:MAG: helix-turn-helix transcriptional regulator [Betaproteobacteria bacterium]|nr:helix-turn-helix transcriptional regulator [Betaproteobacteria bacterium]